jgi:hypothetical protein
VKPANLRFAKDVLQRNHRRLYKFRSFENRPALERLFLQQEVYWPSPAQLNDPFECKPTIRAPIIRSALDGLKARRAAKQLLKSQGEMSRAEVRARSRGALNAEVMAKAAVDATKQLPEAMEKYRLYSLSARKDHLLLWSHYANSHSGICIGFDASGNDFGLAFEVHYSSELPTSDFFEDSHWSETLRSMALTKSDVWKYENEFRLIAEEPHPGPPQLVVKDHVYKFEPQRLVEVIMGCQISAENEASVHSWVANYPTAIALRKARRSTSKFALEFVNIELSCRT